MDQPGGEFQNSPEHPFGTAFDNQRVTRSQQGSNQPNSESSGGDVGINNPSATGPMEEDNLDINSPGTSSASSQSVTNIQYSATSTPPATASTSISLLGRTRSSTMNASYSTSTPSSLPSRLGVSTIAVSSPLAGSSTGSSVSPTITAAGPPTAATKRKRSRVNPDQLAQLERIFLIDRSPTAARRKEISDALGMNERQTQIWFQNRRAKAKMQETKGKARFDSPLSPGGNTPPSTPPELSAGFEGDLLALIHERDPISIIPCTDLTIGTWHRHASRPGSYDLVAYIGMTNRRLTWYIRNEGAGFKMEVPFEIITNADTHNISSAQARAIFSLTRPPDFYMEETIRAQGIKHWKKCDDWTQGMQATKVLQHEIIGSAVQLVNALNIFRDVSGVGSSASTSGGSSAQRSPTFVGSPSSQTGAESSSNAALQPVRLQPPPLMGLTPSPTFSYPNPAVQQLRPSHPSQGRRRSFTGPPSYTDASNNLLGPLAPLARDTMPGSMGIPTSSTYLAQTGTASSMQQYFSNYMQSSYSSYPLHGSSSSSPTQPVFPNQIPQPTSLSDYSSVPISHSVASRPSNPSQQFAPPFPSTRRFSEISASTSSSSGFVTLNSPLSTSTFISSNSGPHVRESNSSDSRIGVDMHSPTLHHSDMALSYSSYLTPQDTSNRPTTSEPTDVAALQTPALADGSRSNAESTYDDPTQSTRS